MELGQPDAAPEDIRVLRGAPLPGSRAGREPGRAPRHPVQGLTGWAYCARTPQQDFFLAYFEKGCPAHNIIRGAVPYASYRWQWFDPRDGTWSTPEAKPVKADNSGRIELPGIPSDDDWGIKLMLDAGSG